MSRENITFGGNAINILGEEIKVGDKAPDFVAVNNDLSPFESKELNGTVRIYSVVPSIDTGVCAIQTGNFNQMATDLGDNVHVITISNDLPFGGAEAFLCEGQVVGNGDDVNVIA